MPMIAARIPRHLVLDERDSLSHQHAMQSERITWSTVEREAAALGATSYARAKWRQANRGVPPVWRIRIVEALALRGVTAILSDFDDLPANPGKVAA